MKRAELFHPRVFTDSDWSLGYYKRNARNIKMVGQRFAGLLKSSGFSGTTVLDTGCGFGAVPIEIARAFPGVRITGVDLSEPLLEMARSFAEKEGVSDRIVFSTGDVHSLEFPDNSFDLTVNTFMLHVVEDPVAMLNELERVTRDDGRIMITDLRRIWLGAVVRKLKTAYTLEEAVGVIGQSRLRKGSASKGPFWWDYMVP
jgi:ubiquinone/menaquinone biosynthesis C-methylase UbiE